MPDRSPVQVKKGDDGELFRILLFEEWYDYLKPLYDYYRIVTDVVSIKVLRKNKIVTDAVSITVLHEILDLVAELVNYLVVEIEAYGWAISISMWMLIKWAAALSVPVGKFAYRRVGQPTTAGGSLPATAGGPLPGTAGSTSTQIVEFPTIE